ncbi:unnamed protein product [Hymenolepis diminuta]|uniref:Ovule protein n=1 Tax=Hymenolepis diminuta TaxID=6216 RepID=A0A0R3SX60_HYMDI|nr:unnamed protein product [Hymenolepis diminuta]
MRDLKIFPNEVSKHFEAKSQRPRFHLSLKFNPAPGNLGGNEELFGGHQGIDNRANKMLSNKSLDSCSQSKSETVEVKIQFVS